MENERIRKN